MQPIPGPRFTRSGNLLDCTLVEINELPQTPLALDHLQSVGDILLPRSAALQLRSVVRSGDVFAHESIAPEQIEPQRVGDEDRDEVHRLSLPSREITDDSLKPLIGNLEGA